MRTIEELKEHCENLGAKSTLTIHYDNFYDYALVNIKESIVNVFTFTGIKGIGSFGLLGSGFLIATERRLIFLNDKKVNKNPSVFEYSYEQVECIAFNKNSLNKTWEFIIDNKVIKLDAVGKRNWEQILDSIKKASKGIHNEEAKFKTVKEENMSNSIEESGRQNTKAKGGFNWLVITAGFIGLMVIISSLMSSNPSTILTSKEKQLLKEIKSGGTFKEYKVNNNAEVYFHHDNLGSVTACTVFIQRKYQDDGVVKNAHPNGGLRLQISADGKKDLLYKVASSGKGAELLQIGENEYKLVYSSARGGKVGIEPTSSLLSDLTSNDTALILEEVIMGREYNATYFLDGVHSAYKLAMHICDRD